MPNPPSFSAPIPSFAFSHLPPASIRCRWPGQGDFQWSLSGVPSLLTVLPWIDPFLDPDCRTAVRHSTSALSGPLRFFDLPLTRPWQPMRRRRWGFGAISRDRSIHQDKPSGFLFLHFAWPFLTHADRAVAASSHLYWDLYASMRLHAARRSVSVLRQPRPAPTAANLPTKLSMPRALLFACALLRFDFCYGDFQRWLAGEYTNRFRDWPASFRNLWNMCERPPFDDQPPPQWERAFRICTEGAPLRGHYCPTLAELAKRDAYDNHAPVRENAEDVESKFAKEEFKSYHVALPRFLLWFIPGVMLNPLQWAVRYGKGRICVDCTNGPSGKGSPGSPNTFVPPPREDTDDCPQVYYATAWQGLLRYAWRLRATFPNEDILGHCDDIDAAFRRVLYHPDMAPAFSYVFGAFLLIAVGQVFGSRHAPSHFTILSELRSYVASCGSVPPSISDPLVDATEIVASPRDVPLAPAVSDSINPRLKEPFSYFEKNVQDIAFESRCKVTGYFHRRCNVERAVIKKRKKALLATLVKLRMLRGYRMQSERRQEQSRTISSSTPCAPTPKKPIESSPPKYSSVAKKANKPSTNRSTNARSRSPRKKNSTKHAPRRRNDRTIEETFPIDVRLTPTNPGLVAQYRDQPFSSQMNLSSVESVSIVDNEMITQHDAMRFQSLMDRDRQVSYIDTTETEPIHQRNLLHFKIVATADPDEESRLTEEEEKQRDGKKRGSIVARLFAEKNPKESRSTTRRDNAGKNKRPSSNGRGRKQY